MSLFNGKKTTAPSSFSNDSSPKSLAVAYGVQKSSAKKKMASGGMVSPMPEMEHEEHYSSIADAILKKKKAAAPMETDLSGTEDPNYFDELNEEAAADELPPEAPSEQNMSLASQIRKKMHAKMVMP